MGAAAASEQRLEQLADEATFKYGFSPGERAAWLETQRRVLAEPSFAKKVQRRQRKFTRAQRMSPTIKTRNG